MSRFPIWPIDLSQRPLISQCGLSVHNREGGQTTERYLLPNHWCLHLYRYHARVEIPGCKLAVHPGALTIFPSGLSLAYHFHEVSQHIFVHFKLAATPGTERKVASWQETGSDNVWWSRELSYLTDAAFSEPLRAEVKLWELLFVLSERDESASNRHPSLEKALRLIENRLAEPLSPPEIAREVGLSHNHLLRLFQKETGTTINATIRARRAERAKHLLENTTLPLASIAAQVGVEAGKGLCDLLRRETNRSPREWRNRRSDEGR